eukprot:701425-Pleurochrysis_carterae.AAC.1
MEGRLLLDVVVRQGTAILKLLARKDQALLVRRNTLLILDLRLHIVNGIRWLDLKSDGLARGEVVASEQIEQQHGQSSSARGLVARQHRGRPTCILKRTEDPSQATPREPPANTVKQYELAVGGK